MAEITVSELARLLTYNSSVLKMNHEMKEKKTPLYMPPRSVYTFTTSSPRCPIWYALARCYLPSPC